MTGTPSNPASYSHVSSGELLDELDRAISSHLIWLGIWHKGILGLGGQGQRRGSGPTGGELPADIGHLDRFGSWFVRNQHKGLVNQPAIRAVAKLHKDIHDDAQAVTAAVQAGGAVDEAVYDRVMALSRDFVAQARRLENAFAQASSDLDPLTGLNNRQAMMRNLALERERALRGGQPCCLALGDLDHFKSVNDTYGHSAGDVVLATAAEVFQSHIRPYDAVYRHGGEEFLFCLPNADPAAAMAVLDRLRRGLEDCTMRFDSGETLNVTGSFGIAPVTKANSLEQTIEFADQALYSAKDQGRNRVVAWDTSPETDEPATGGSGDGIDDGG